MRKALRIGRGWPAYEIVIEVGEAERDFLADYGKLTEAEDRSDERKLGIALRDLLAQAMELRNRLKEEKPAA